MPLPETCTIRTTRKKSSNQRVCSMHYMRSRVFRPAKRFGPRLLTTVPFGINRIVFIVKEKRGV